MKYASKIESEIESATSIAELLEIKETVLATRFTDHDSEYLLNLIEWSLKEFE